MNSRVKRKSKGSAIAEFGPSLFVLLIIIFFPMLDMLGLAAQYCMGWYANFMCCRELSVRRRSEETNVISEVNANFNSSGFSKFLGIDDPDDLKHTVEYTDTVPGGAQGTVTCSTEVTAKPFIHVPLPFVTCPGLNADVKFTIASQRPREVTN